MNRNILVSLIVLIAVLLSACVPQQKGPDAQAVAVAVILTQTAAAPQIPTAAATAPAPTMGTISGKVGLMAPPTPRMTVYALDPATGKWGFTEAPAAQDGMASFNLSMPPGSYQIFAFTENGAGVVYSEDGWTLATVTVAANQTVSDLSLYPPGSGDCGVNIGVPASPDGKYKAIAGATAECKANMNATAEAMMPALRKSEKGQPIRFAVGPTSVELNGTLLNGERDRYAINIIAGEKLEVLLTSLENNAAFTILGPDQKPVPGTEEGQDATQYLEANAPEGPYIIQVGSTRGNTTYTLNVNVSGLQ